MSQQYGTDYLLAAVRDVASRVSPLHPSAVTQRQFDAQRASSGTKCPRASDISKQLKATWPELLELVFDGDVNEYHVFALKLRGRGDRYPADLDICVSALRLAAKRLGTTHLRPHEYVAEREKAIGSSRATARRDLELRWPRQSQIEKFGWNRVLSQSGLEIPPDVKKQSEGMASEAAMELFLICRGYVPMTKQLVTFTAEHGVSLKHRDEKTEITLAKLRATRESKGLWTPPRPLPRRQAPPFSTVAVDAESWAAAEARASFPRRTRDFWSDSRILDGLDFAVSELGPGRSLTQKELRKLSKKYSGQIPSPGTVTKYAKKNGTNLKKLREQALQRSMP